MKLESPLIFYEHAALDVVEVPYHTVPPDRLIPSFLEEGSYHAVILVRIALAQLHNV